MEYYERKATNSSMVRALVYTRDTVRIWTLSLTFSLKGIDPMRNCLNCKYYCPGDEYHKSFCMEHYIFVYIPLDSTECKSYLPRSEEES